MLTIGKVGPGNAVYYGSAVVAGVEDYYAGDGDAPGVWIGRTELVGAVAGALATEVESRLLLEARCAPDGTKLGKTTVTERSVTAFDLTFSAPKSVSVLYALGDADVVAAVEAAHTAAVDQAIRSLSPRIAFTRTGRAGVAVVDADGVFGIRFRHRTSRALDPQLHDHVLVANVVRTTSDGEWRTLDARGLYRSAKAAGVEYQAYLRSALQGLLGVEFAAIDVNGQADIVGIDQALIDAFSTRSVDIDAALDAWRVGFVEREGRDPTSAEVGTAHKTITLATRPAKPDEAGVSTSTLRARWRARAGELVDVDQMIASTIGEMQSPAPVVAPAVDVVLAAVEERHAEWSESQLIEQIAMRTTGPDPATIADTIDRVRDEVMASAGVVDLCPPVEAGEVVRASDGRPVTLAPSAVRYTTTRHLLREIDLVDWAQTPAMARHRRLDATPEMLEGLDRSQVDAVAAMLDTTRPVVAVVGPAGAGKTRMLAAAVDAWRDAGVCVFGAGPSAASARQLADGAGLAADTLHKLVYEHHTRWVELRQPPSQRWALPAGSVVVIDEAGMVDTRLLHQYAHIALRNHWRTILVGDHRQLDPVDAGGMFAELVDDPDVRSVELDTLHRFAHAWEADATLALRNGDRSVVDLYDRHGRIHAHDEHAEAVKAVADTAVAGIGAGRDVLVMASTNTVVDELNTTITERLVSAGRLDPARIEIAGHVFHRNQAVVTRSNHRTLTFGPGQRDWVRNGDRWTIETGNDRELHVRNLDNGHRCRIPAGYVADGNVTVGYASTVHRAQGATVDDAHLLIDHRTDAAHLYVGLTRGRNSNHVHTAPAAFESDHHGPDPGSGAWTAAGEVVAAIERQPQRTSAIARRRELRHSVAESSVKLAADRGHQPGDAARRVDASRQRLESLRRRPSTRGLGR